MTTSPTTHLYKRQRFPAEIIRHCVWLYFRFSLSYRDVQEMMAKRGVIVSHEAVRYEGRKFGQGYAHQRRRPRPGDKWYVDEVFLTIDGERHYLWRAVDQDDQVLDILVQSRRNKKATKKFFKKLLKGLRYVRRVIITDKSRATPPRSARSCLVWSIGKAALSITGGRTSTDQPVHVSDVCSGSHRRDIRSASSPRMGLLPRTSARVATAFRPLHTGRQGGNASRYGESLPAWKWRRKGRVPCRPTTSVPCDRLTVS